MSSLNELKRYIDKCKKYLDIETTTAWYWAEAVRAIKPMEGSTFILTLNKAIAANTRYEDALFSTGLVSAAQAAVQQPRFITYSFSTKTVNINMDAHFGKLETYASIVRQFRAEHGVDGSIVNRSVAWEKYYRAGHGENISSKPAANAEMKAKYNAFMLYVSNKTGEKAPYWELLDRGEAAPFSADEGGIAHPPMKGTNFVSNTEKELRDLLQGQLNMMAKDPNRKLAAIVKEMQLGKRVVSAITNKRYSTTSEIPAALRTFELGKKQFEMYVRSGKIRVRAK